MRMVRAALLCCVLLQCVSRVTGQVAPTPGSGALDPQIAASVEVPQALDATDWSSIREAYEANRHAAVAADDGYQARNPGQQWVARFDGRGFSVQPDAGGWTWGLQLERYGFAGQERLVTEPTQVTAAGQRVAYDWDDTLEEWYVNDSRGVEHGYTVRDRPPCEQKGPLTFTLAVRGALSSRVQADGRGVRFLNGEGAPVLTYAGLSVFDADGQALSASFEPHAEGLLLTVDECGARYPLTIDPTVQQAYLKASNTEASDMFGYSVAVSGDTVVVTAPGEDSFADGVNGNQSDNNGFQSGAAYVFVRSGTSWSQQAYLKASNTYPEDSFGRSVAVSGDTVVIGAPLENSAATGVNGDQYNLTALDSGAVYVFVRSGTSWSQQAYLKASNTEGGDRFGGSVAVSGDTVLVGAPFESSNATGVNGNQGDNGAPLSGAAYVFVRSGAVWSQQAYLKASNTEGGDEFGDSVSVSGDTVVVGAPDEASNATGVNGDQNNNSTASSGAAYVFVRSGTVWSQQAYLKASNTEKGDFFAYSPVSVSVSGDTVVVGAPFEDSSATGVNGDQSDNIGHQSGAAYVFVRSGTVWSQQAYLKASNTDAWDQFGYAVAISGKTVVIGAASFLGAESSDSTGVNGDQSNNNLSLSGAAYVFVRSGTSWSQAAYLKASNTGWNDHFGISVAVSDDTVAVGGLYESSNATGVNGDQNDNSAVDAGAAYVFELDAWTDLGFGLAGVSGIPSLVGTGTLVGGSATSLDLSSAKPSAPCGLFVGLSNNPTSFKGGTLIPVPILLTVSFTTSPTGTVALPFTWPTGLPSGFSTYYQYAIKDAAAVQGVALSNALKATTP